MDSITHLSTGLAIGGLIAGNSGRYTAMGIGAAVAVLPDIDVFIGIFMPDMQALAFHRGVTHSIWFALLITPVLGWLLHKWKPVISVARWSSITFLAISSHLFLDWITSYGTQLLAPFSDRLFYLATLSIIDPLFTLPLLVAGVIALLPRTGLLVRRKVLSAGLLISAAYLVLTFFNKSYINETFKQNLQDAGIEFSELETKPVLLNNLLWRGIAKTNDGFFTGFYSHFDSCKNIRFTYTPQNKQLLENIKNDPGVQRLLWFADGFYAVEKAGNALHFHNLRLGKAAGWVEYRETRYVYSYLIEPGGKEPSKIRKRELSFSNPEDQPRGRELWTRIWGLGCENQKP